MQASGHGNDGLMILLPVGVAVVVGIILFGGTTNAVEGMNAIVAELAYEAMAMVSTMF